MSNNLLSEPSVLLVDDEAQLLQSASIVLRASGISEVLMLDDARKVLPLLASRTVGVIVLDLSMPHISGREILERLAADYPDIPVILMTATNDLETAVRCMQAGASDYLVKPVDGERLVASVRRALEIRALRTELFALKERLLADSPHKPAAFAEIVTQNPAMFAIFRYIEAIASSSPQPVLITGETGTGKELIAKALHRLSGRPGNLVAVNVAGLDDTLFSDTLFGHARGAFTGADRPREGLIASAGDGTLFLDEVGDLSMASQVKLLRLLQDGTYYPIGSDRPQRSRARVVVATHCDVRTDVDRGKFRKDLYFRLRTHHIQLPPLRARLEDLPHLVAHFVEKAAKSLGKPAPSVPLPLYQWLRNYPFPGNIRELEGMVFDAVARCRGTVLPLQSFKEAGSAGNPPLASPEWEHIAAGPAWLPDALPTLKDAEDALMVEALRRADGNQGVAANLLGISRQALNKRLTRRGPAGFSADLQH
ncbi:MAG: sigma-54-dependent Fis family transcriptional regulator [Betaproteobacteria bacterium]|nr:sigma-54-dependent Fis family transcriptional regulator [Betaproteobacteria bacterium]